MDLRRMQMSRVRQCFTAVLGALIVLSLVVVPAGATHAWGTYHWTRSAALVTFQLGDNLTTSTWKTHLTTAVSDWNMPLGSAPKVIELRQPVAGGTNPKTCKPKAGWIQVCNAAYGITGWLGIAQVWISGGHVSQGTAKQNDTYFSKAPYNTPAWRQMVICQEVAHTFGLGHVNETYDTANTGSCMDYTNDPAGTSAASGFVSNEHPNEHDFTVLADMYAHSHGSTTTSSTTTGLTRAEEEVTGLDPKGWGRVTERDEKGRPVHYERELGPDLKVLTFVIPVDEPGDAPSDGGTGTGGHSHEGVGESGGHAHEGDHGKQDGGKPDGGKRDSAQNDGGHTDANRNDGGKQADGRRDRQKADHQRDGAKQADRQREGSKQRQGDGHDRHDHGRHGH